MINAGYGFALILIVLNLAPNDTYVIYERPLSKDLFEKCVSQCNKIFFLHKYLTLTKLLYIPKNNPTGDGTVIIINTRSSYVH